MDSPPLETVYQAISALYGGPNSSEIEKASLWLADVQKSIHSWKIADELLQHKKDLNSCYFGAQTMRAKIQHNLAELPSESHVSLRDSLIDHLQRAAPDVAPTILTQLCLALTDLALQMPSWQNCVMDIIKLFSNKDFVLLELLTLIPQEIDSPSLRIGQNRREDITNQLQINSSRTMSFLKECISNSNGSSNTTLKAIKCMTSWLQVRAVNLQEIPQNAVIGICLQILREHTSINIIHEAASNCLIALLQCLEETDKFENIERLLFDSIMALEESYHMAVAHEEEEKVANYARLFTELGESFLYKIIDHIDDGNSTHYAIKSLELVLICVGYHDYEVAEITFNLWYKLSEEIYRRDHQQLTDAFKPHAERLIEALARHCQCEPDMTQLPDETDDFFAFRRKVMGLIRDVVFIVGSSSVFKQMFAALQNNASWEQTEAALFVMQAVARNILPDEHQFVPKVVEAIVSMPESTHQGVRATCIALLGELSEWIQTHSECFTPCLNTLLAALSHPALATPAASALQILCAVCGSNIVDHVERLVEVVRASDQLPQPAAIYVMRALSYVIIAVPAQQFSPVLLEATAPSLQQLRRLCVEGRAVKRGTSSDPVQYLDRFAALYRELAARMRDDSEPEFVLEPRDRPWRAVDEAWPVLIEVMEKFGHEERVMERICRAIRFAVRSVRRLGAHLAAPLCAALSAAYRRRAHSCVLYLCSVLVDEWSHDASAPLLQLLEALLPPAFAMLQGPDGFREHPDTVDDIFRLFIRFMQQMPVQLLTCGLMPSIVQCAVSGAALDHRDASASLMNFLTDLVRKTNCPSPADAETQHAKALTVELVNEYGSAIACAVLEAAVLHLHRSQLASAADVLLELGMHERRSHAGWLGEALRRLPRGPAAATPDQQQRFHDGIIQPISGKDATKLLRDFAKLYR